MKAYSRRTPTPAKTHGPGRNNETLAVTSRKAADGLGKPPIFDGAGAWTKQFGRVISNYN